MKPISLYIHIPFCKSKCYYCDFLSFANKEPFMDMYIDILILEMKSHAAIIRERKIMSIFIGGGTPSTLPLKSIQKIMQEINLIFNVEKNAEITIECNPGTLTREKILGFKESGINRISLGLQSTFDNHLKTLGRIHSFKEFEENFHMLREIGYHNINVDLMFGLPEQTINDWIISLEKVVKLKPEHISAYSLITEAGTPFFEMKKKNLLILPDEDTERLMYYETNRILEKEGYVHYEISNYSKAGYECRHNNVYWTLKDYIGIGLGAASYNNLTRSENTADFDNYIKSNGNLDEIIISRHISSVSEQKEEFIFLGLRLIKGISNNEYKGMFDEDLMLSYGNIINKLTQQELLKVNEDNIRLTAKGIDVSNYVMAQFLG